MFEEKLSMIPGFSVNKKPSAAVNEHKPRKRFAKLGSNANHPITARMRDIKDRLRLTTAQLVYELNAYEHEHQKDSFGKRSSPDKPAWAPLTSVLMSSYLQGWVAQDLYMSQMAKRLENLLKFKEKSGEVVGNADIRTIMDGWYKTLGINPNDPNTSATRQLGRMIAPYYKRPVLTAISGRFNLGLITDGMQMVNITDAKGMTHDFLVDLKEQLLIKDNQEVKVGDVIQYSVLMQTSKKDGVSVVTQEPSINHTTFYRWYSQNKMPRSITTIEQVQAAVETAAKANKVAA